MPSQLPPPEPPSGLMRAAADVSHEGILTLTLDGRIEWFNKAFELAVGFSADRVKGQSIFQVFDISTENINEIEKKLQKSSKITITLNLAVRGQECIQELTITKALDSYVIVARFPSRRQKKYVEALEKGIGLFANDGQGEVVFLQLQATKGWPVVFVSRNVVKILGHSADSLSGREFKGLIHPDDLKKLEAKVDVYLSEQVHWFNRYYRIKINNGKNLRDYKLFYDRTAVVWREDKPIYFYKYLIEKHEKSNGNKNALSSKFDKLDEKVKASLLVAAGAFGKDAVEWLSHHFPALDNLWSALQKFLSQL